MPDDQTIQLPVSSLKELFVCYCAEVDPGDQLSDSHFRAIVKNEFTYLRIHKYKKFKQCEYCLECDTKVSDMKLAPAVRQAWTERKRIHREPRSRSTTTTDTRPGGIRTSTSPSSSTAWTSPR